MKTQFNITTSFCDLDRYPDRESFLHMLSGFDGVELMCFEPDEQGIIPAEKVNGVHMICPYYWVDFWNGDRAACLKEFDTDGNIRAYYGGDTRQSLLDSFRRDLEIARRYEAEYVVFHVADSGIEETILGEYKHTDAEVIDACCELVNALFSDVENGPMLLLENLWEPGLRFTDPEMTARLLNGVKYAKKGLMLDTGHLMHTMPSLRTQAQYLAYIHEMLDMHGDLCREIRGVHLNQSLTGGLMRRYMNHPPTIAADYESRRAQIYDYVFQIDRHRPFTCPGVRELIERISPDYLTFEFISNDRAEHERMLRAQKKALI